MLIEVHRSTLDRLVALHCLKPESRGDSAAVSFAVAVEVAVSAELKTATNRILSQVMWPRA